MFDLNVLEDYETKKIPILYVFSRKSSIQKFVLQNYEIVPSTKCPNFIIEIHLPLEPKKKEEYMRYQSC